jgi:hypothetical protein
VSEREQARKSCDDPNNVTSKCFFNIVSNARKFTTDEALNSFKWLVGCRLGWQNIKSRIFMFFEGLSDDIIQPFDRITFSLEELNGSTRQQARVGREGRRHKIIFNQHIPFEHLAFH